jgi:hypothetical protein
MWHEKSISGSRPIFQTEIRIDAQGIYVEPDHSETADADFLCVISESESKIA